MGGLLNMRTPDTGKQLKAMRKVLGITQQEFANRAGYSKARIAHI